MIRISVAIIFTFIFCASIFAQGSYSDSLRIRPIDFSIQDTTTIVTKTKTPKAIAKMQNLQSKVMNFMYAEEPNDFKFRANFFLPMESKPEYSASLGGGVRFTFKTAKQYSLHKSSIPFSIRFGLQAPFRYYINCSPEIYTSRNIFKINLPMYYHQSSEHFYGIGFEEVHNVKREKGVTSYMSRKVELMPTFAINAFNPWWYFGVVGGFIHERTYRPGTALLTDERFIAQGGTSEGSHYTVGGFGGSIVFDTREADYWRTLFDAKAIFYIGSGYKFGKLKIDYRQYEDLGNGNSLGWAVGSSNVLGKYENIPLFQYASVGDFYSHRGYYCYQYRDRSILKAELEYHYQFNFPGYLSQIIFNRLGFSIFGGIAAIGPNIVKYHAVLPSFGVGARIKITAKRCFRVDYAFNTVNKVGVVYWGMSQSF